jgi:hypothetical protein
LGDRQLARWLLPKIANICRTVGERLAGQPGECLIDEHVGDHHASARLLALRGCGTIGMIGEREPATQSVEVGCRHAIAQLQRICNPGVHRDEQVRLRSAKLGVVAIDGLDQALDGGPSCINGMSAVGRNDKSALIARAACPPLGMTASRRSALQALGRCQNLHEP